MNSMRGLVLGDKSGTGKRRGAKLGILIAIMTIIPGIVAGTSYVSGSATGTLTSATANSASAGCGWWTDSNIDGFVSAASLGTVFTAGGSAVPTSGTVTVTVTALESSTYEYEIDEIVFGCISTPAAPASTSITVTIGSATVTGATQAVIELTNAEPDAAQNPTTTSGGSACAGGLYLPATSAAANFAAGNAYTWSAISHGAVAGCGSMSLTLSPAAGLTTDTGLAWVSFAFLTTGATGLSASAAFTFAYTATVTG